MWLEKKKYNGGSAAGESYLTLMNRGHVYDLGGGAGAHFLHGPQMISTRIMTNVSKSSTTEEMPIENATIW